MEIKVNISQVYDKYNQGPDLKATVEGDEVLIETPEWGYRIDVDELKRLIKLIEVTEGLDK